jgi:hypothetical protein
MKRTTIWLTADQYWALQRKGMETGWSMSELIREGVRRVTGVGPSDRFEPPPQRFPTRQEQVILALYYAQLSPPQIAEHVGISEEEVTTSLRNVGQNPDSRRGAPSGRATDSQLVAPKAGAEPRRIRP